MSRVLILCAIFTVVIGCQSGKESPRGFSLPQGNAAEGKAAFVTLKCNACHSTPEVDQLETSGSENYTSRALGREVGRVKTYADLVTSIINPSHRVSWAFPYGEEGVDGASRMRNYNEIMTVEQLVDLVTYLQPHYPVRPRGSNEYKNYYP